MEQHKLPVSLVFGVIRFNNLSIKFFGKKDNTLHTNLHYIKS